MARVLISSNMEIEIILRVMYACLLAWIIGLERAKKHKSAGLRTYILVAIGATIFTIVSKYGFLDIATEKTRVDVSRVAHTIVTGVGFLGAMVMFAGVRSRLESCDIPKFLKGLPITLVAASLVSLSFLGFAGVVENIFA